MQESLELNPTIFKSLFHSPNKLLKHLFDLAIQENLSVAVWKMPSEDNTHLLIHSSSTPSTFDQQLNKNVKGFVFNSFENDLHLFLEADIHFQTNPTNPKSEIIRKDNEKTLHFIKSKELKNSTKKYHYTKSDLEETTSDDFMKITNKAIQAINNSTYEKVVISKIKATKLDENFHPIDSLIKLSNNYPLAFNSLVSIPEIGTWLGASPETLISYDKNKVFKTVALAGTQKIEDTTLISEISWRIKEIEEQAMVSRYIIDCFKKIRLREFEEHGPKTITAGKLAHLNTEFQVNNQEVQHKELPQTMLNLLHPTSAVCGMPKEQAMAFILSKEKHDRKFYSGFLGPSAIEGHSQLFVNLRCAEILSEKAIIYAGAGITHNSNAEKEWLETEYKCQTIMKAL